MTIIPMMDQKVIHALSGISVLRHHLETKGNVRSMADIARAQPQEAVVVMLGHDEGVLAYGPSIGAAASLLSFAVRNFLSNACSGETSCAHGACHVS